MTRPALTPRPDQERAQELEGTPPPAADDPIERAARVACAGLSGDPGTAETALELLARDPDRRVRGAALGALTRLGDADRLAIGWRVALADPDPSVRCRACEVAPAIADGFSEGDLRVLVEILGDPDADVAEAGAFALGELGDAAIGAGAVPALVAAATGHPDPLAREAAVAALGSLGHPEGRAAVLAACTDRPAIRRRAVLALAAFDGEEVEAAIDRALTDRDWQVRQAAEDLRSTS